MGCPDDPGSAEHLTCDEETVCQQEAQVDYVLGVCNKDSVASQYRTIIIIRAD